MEKQKGQTLIEMLIVLALFGSIGAIGISTAQSVQRRVALSGATSELRATIMYVRAMAIARDRNVAIRFRADDRAWTWTVYEDGDGDGVRNDDISKGKDPQVLAVKRFQYGPAGIGLPSGKVPDPMANNQPLSLRSPVRFNTSMLCSFTRQGEVTNGSVVLSDGSNATIVRVHGTSGRIQVLRWNGTEWKTGV
jgi:prepilin-type N-terminal cleavage/methylation domain-containing protein